MRSATESTLPMVDEIQEPDTAAKDENQIGLARRVAHVMGPACAAAKAVARYDALAAQGFQSCVLNTAKSWWVQEP